MYNLDIVTRERAEEITTISDISISPAVIRGVYSEVMRNWLLDDNHPISWERVVMVNIISAFVRIAAHKYLDMFTASDGSGFQFPKWAASSTYRFHRQVFSI